MPIMLCFLVVVVVVVVVDVVVVVVFVALLWTALKAGTKNELWLAVGK